MRRDPRSGYDGVGDIGRAIPPIRGDRIAYFPRNAAMRILVYTVAALWLALVVVGVMDTDAAARVIALIDHK